MATLVPLAQTTISFNGANYVLTSVRQATASDSFTVPGGSKSAVALGPVGSATATVTNSEGSDTDQGGATQGTVTIAGGTIGEDYTVITRHAGSLAGF